MTSISPIYKIKDVGFDVNFIAKYDLYLHIHLNHLNICVFDTEENKSILFESYDFEEEIKESNFLECMQKVWEGTHFLSAGFWHKVVVVIVGQDFVFIPYEHYNEEAAINYLRLNCHFNEKTHDLHHTKHYELDAVCYFAVSQEIKNWLNSQYTSVPVMFAHSNSCFIQGLLTEHEDGLCVIIHPENITIALLKDRKIQFVNSFPYTHQNDLLYFVLFVMDELKLSTDDTKVKVWGTQSDLYDIRGMLRGYIQDVKIGDRPKLKYGIGFDDSLPSYFAYDLFAGYYLMR